MSKPKHLTLKILLAILVLLILAAGALAWFTLPVYPAFQREVDTLSQLREALADSPEARNLPVLDPAEFGGLSTRFCLRLDDRTRLAKPTGYELDFFNGSGDQILVQVPVLAAGQLSEDATEYRGVQAAFQVHDVQRAENPLRVLELWLELNGRICSLSGYIPVAGLNDEQTAAREAALTELLYQMADRLLEPESLCLSKEGSWFCDYKVRGGAVWLECELTLENHSTEPLTGCLTACFPDDVGKLVQEERLPGLLTSEVEPVVPTTLPEPAVLELKPGRTTLRVTFIGYFAGDTEKHDRLLPELYWTPQDGSGETILQKR